MRFDLAYSTLSCVERRRSSRFVSRLYETLSSSRRGSRLSGATDSRPQRERSTHVSDGGSSCSDETVNCWRDRSIVVTAAAGCGVLVALRAPAAAVCDGGGASSPASHAPLSQAARTSEERGVLRIFKLEKRV